MGDHLLAAFAGTGFNIANKHNAANLVNALDTNTQAFAENIELRYDLLNLTSEILHIATENT